MIGIAGRLKIGEDDREAVEPMIGWTDGRWGRMVG